MNSSMRGALYVCALIGAGVSLASCGSSSVAGSTFEGANGAVKIEFLSNGKASASMGPILSTTCTYEQSGKTITLICEGDKEVFTINDDNSLSGPPGGMLARLTKKKA